MNFSANKNQYLFLGHKFTYELFGSLGNLGWVYLYLQGVSLITILIALSIFRLLLNFAFTPLTHFVLKRWAFKPVAFVGIFLQAAFLGSFYFAAQNLLFLSITIILMAAYDGFYWVVVSNLERLVPQPSDIAKNVGLANATAVMAGAFGAVATAYGLSVTPGVIFIVSFVGMLSSFIPIGFMKLSIPHKPHKSSVFRIMFLDKPVNQFLKNPLILIILAMGLINEFIQILPIFLAHFKVTLIDVSLIYGAMCIVSSVASIFVGRYENDNKSFLAVFFGVSTMLLFFIFAFLPSNQLALFLLFYSVFGASWEIGISAISQKFCQQYQPGTDGGILEQLLDNIGRNLMYPILLILMVSTQNVTQVVQLMFVFSAMIVVAVLVIEPKARQKLVEISL